MHTEKVFLTPEIAKAYLSGNKSNRTVSSSSVTKYAKDMASGNWRFTHQGILLGKDGVVIDGQHRMLAVIKSGVGIWCLLSVDQSLESPKDLPIDVGYKRAAHFILGIHPMLAAAAGQAIQIARAVGNCSAAETGEVAKVLDPHFKTLMNNNFTATRGISTAPVQLGGIVRLALGDDPDYIVSTYSDLVHSRFQTLAPYPASFFRQVVVERQTFQGRAVFSRAVRMFDASKRDLKKMQIKDENFAFEEARKLLCQVLDGSK